MNHHLGTLSLTHDAGRLDLRRKALALASALGCHPVTAARRISSLSSHIRASLARDGAVQVNVALQEDPPQSLVFEWGAGMSVRLAIPPGRSWSERFLHERSAALLDPSREVLMAQLTAKNRELEVHQESLERTIGQRTHELRESMERAEAASRTKSAFLANMSHEIRTPMNAILGYAQILLRNQALPSGARRQVETIGRSGEHLLGIINDILDMSKIEAGQMMLRPVAFNPDEMISDLETMMKVRSEAKGLELLVASSGEKAPALLGDEHKIRQILINMLGNAIKFTQQGRVELRWSAVCGPEGVWRLECEVEDTGPGIARTDLPRLFQSFEQVNSGSLAPHPGGTGLGLSISRSLARLMGGDVTVRSQVGVGSVFCFHCQLEATESPVHVATSNRRAVGLTKGQEEIRVLIVDDRESNRDVLQGMLEPLGFALRQANDGQQAVEAFKVWRPRVILMDMQMPVMDGRAATRAIRELAAGHPVTIIAVTASVFDDERANILEDGADAFLRKPFREQELLELMEIHAGVQMDFEEESPRAVVAAAPTALPATVIDALREAVEGLDGAAIRRVAASLREHDVVAAQYIEDRVAAYDYDALTALLSPRGPP